MRNLFNSFVILSSLTLGFYSLAYAEDFDPKSLEIIKRNDPFKSGKAVEKEANWDCKAAAERKGSLELLTTSVLENRANSVAQFKIGSVIKEVKEGDQLLPELQIHEIQRLQVFILNIQEKKCEVVRRSDLK